MAILNRQKLAPTQCYACEKEFTPKRRWQHFCSGACRQAFWVNERGAKLVELKQQVETLNAEVETLKRALVEARKEGSYEAN